MPPSSTPFTPGNQYNIASTSSLIGNPSTGGDPTILNSATVTWNLKDSTGNSIGTGTLNYIPESDGLYSGLLPTNVTTLATAGKWYNLYISATQGGYFRNFPPIQMKAISQ